MKSSSLHYEDTDPGFQIAPMVDVVFVLMLFFMACAGFRAKERDLDARLPAGRGGSPIGLIDLVVSSDGTVLFNNTVVGSAADHQLTALTAKLRTLRETFGDDDTIVIHPAPTITHERVMEVLNAASASGCRKLTFG